MLQEESNCQGFPIQIRKNKKKTAFSTKVRWYSSIPIIANVYKNMSLLQEPKQEQVILWYDNSYSFSAIRYNMTNRTCHVPNASATEFYKSSIVKLVF